MLCGFCKDLGCFAHGSDIIFPVKSLGNGGDYTFHIWNNGTYTSLMQTFVTDAYLTIPFTFNENSETTIKIELPSVFADPEHGSSYVTSSDGACCFTVHGVIKQCQ